MGDEQRDAASRRPTMRDVARAAGVSSTAVSFVLNDREGARIAPETRARILAAAERLGFRPNLTARQLRLQQTQSIGMLTDGIASSPFAGQIIRAVQDAAWESGRLVLLVNTDGHTDVGRSAVRELLDRRVDGLIFASTVTRELAPLPELAAVPSVLINCFPAADGPQLPAVYPAEHAGGGLAAQRLIDAGHREIVYLAGDGDWPALQRTAAFRERMQDARLPVDAGAVVPGPYTIDSGYERARSILQRPDRPTALLCGNDRIALGALLAAQALGLTVPEDLSLVGYDDQEELAGSVHPRLTTVSLPFYELGRQGAETLLSVIAGEPVAARREVVGELVERDSVAAPRHP
ncbi:MAG TPA: LacI family DNA-binding transcriptional regulator [Microbacterium sp.]|uniref:LacI family DNA-binding transcriptional regulator n=1 Tax=Microbacterium sp. TaxID=51671 RepID=UPI002B4599D4|nr:LacI family DNA-binding transcriptional regulator [Microbacterium sp.]HKT56589.1 LacI family DNA-binding transcriptional regulator [Microbacterium sp.]